MCLMPEPVTSKLALTEEVISADQLVNRLETFNSFHLVRGDVTFTDFNAIRDEFRPIIINAVNALVDSVNAETPGLPPVNAPTAG